MLGKSIFIQAIGLFGTVLFSCRISAKQPDAVPRPVCFLSVLHHPSADAGRDHRGNQLCAEHGSFLLPGQQKPLPERENHVRRTVRHAGGSADFHLGRLVVDSSGGREYCGHGRRVYVQSAKNPSRWDAGQFAAVDYLRWNHRLLGGDSGRDRHGSVHDCIHFPLRVGESGFRQRAGLIC